MQQGGDPSRCPFLSRAGATEAASGPAAEVRPDAEAQCSGGNSVAGVAGVRWMLAALAAGSFGLGLVGAVVPGMPTTVFLLIGTYLSVRSCPWLAHWFLSIPILRPYAGFVMSDAPMSARARRIAWASMTLSIAVSACLLWWADRLSMPVGVLMVVLWAAGWVGIWRFRPERGVPAETRA